MGKKLETALNKIVLTAMLVIISLTLSSFESSARERKETMLERKKMKDQKVSIMTRFFYFPLNQTQKKNAIFRFDKNGNKNEIVEYDIEGAVTKRTAYKYNEKGLETEYTEYDALDTVISKHENRYDKKDNITEEFFYGKNNDLTYTRVCKYDAQDNLTEYTLFDKNKKNIGVWKYKYDNKGNKNEVTFYNAAGQYNGKYSYIYNEKDDLLETYTYDKTNKISMRNSNKYDAQGLMRENIIYNAAGTASSWKKFEYDLFRIEKTPPPAAATTEVKLAAAVKKEPVKPAAPVNNTAVETPKEPVKQEPVKDGTENSAPAEDEKKLKKYSPKNEIEIYNPPINTEVTKDQLVMIAIKAKPETVLGLIKSNNYDINTQNAIGWTPLTMAVYTGNLEMVKTLIQEGANPEVADNGGNNSFYFAEYSINKAVTQYMKTIKK